MRAALLSRVIVVAALLSCAPAVAQRLAVDPKRPGRLFVEAGARRRPIPFPAVPVIVANDPKAALAAVFAAPRVVKSAECEYRCTTLHLFDLKSLEHRVLPYGQRWLVFPSETDLWSPEGEQMQIAGVTRRAHPGEGFFAQRVRHLSIVRATDLRRWIRGGHG